MTNHLQCSRVLFITPTSLPEADQLFITVQQKYSALIEWWERPDILDISMSERMGGGEDKKVSEEQKAAEYLNKLAHRLKVETSCC